MEKRRRERINTCLDQLKTILMDVTKKEVGALYTRSCTQLSRFDRHTVVVTGGFKGEGARGPCAMPPPKLAPTSSERNHLAPLECKKTF